MKKLHFGALALAFALFGTALSGCAAADGGRNFFPFDDAATGEAGVDGGGGAMPSDPGDTGDAGDVSDGVQTIPAGQLTAGAWDDNADYSFFKGLFETSVTIACGEQGSEEAEPGLFAAYLPGEDRKNAWGMSVLNRVEVTVTDGEGNPAAGAKVVLEGEGESLAAFSGADGKAYLFPQTAGEYTVSAGYDALVPAAADEGGRVAATLSEARSYTKLDLCFMVDTTGSMGDELIYLQAELGDVISRAEAELDADISLAFVFYRDEGDEYVVRSSDFTADIPAQRAVLAGQNAEGGGDYPEAVHEALVEALGLSWREGAKKILIPVLDAPPHAALSGQDMRAVYGAKVYEAAERGISVMPVAASGADTLTQYLMRSAALLTGGRYVFLTDDSGIGLSHEKPAVGEFTVEYLNSCLVRLIGELYDGVPRPAVDWRNDAA